MSKIHEDVFKLLMDYHNNDKQNFFFTFRQINRYAKLDQGYWFLGNDDYLAVSFWTETDKLNRTPRIYFKINKNGLTSIELRNKDVSSHYDYFQPILIDNLEAIETRNGYVKHFLFKDYIESLISFIKNEKTIIDKFINSSYNAYSASEWANPMEFISAEKFNKQLLNVNSYRDKNRNKLRHIGFLKDFEIKNFGSIKQIILKDLPSKSNWIFITGENGAGKSTLLKAIAVGITKNNDKGYEVAKSKDYGDFIIKFQLHTDNITKENLVESNKKYLSQDTKINGFVTYGPIRLITEGALDSIIINSNKNIQEKITYGLFHPISILKDLSSSYPLFERPKYHDLTKETLLENLIHILPNISEVREGPNNSLLFYEIYDDEILSNEGIPFEKLPSGTRNFVALILDLLIRLQNQQPNITDPADYHGIVLIDEIDIHLHPKLQIELIKQLSDTFPKIQFIVTTHSPIPFLGAPANSIFLRVSNSRKEGIIIRRMKKLEKEIKLLLPNTILTSDIFDFDILEHKSEDDFDNLYLESDYNEIERNIEINNRLENLDKDIFPDNLFDSNIE